MVFEFENKGFTNKKGYLRDELITTEAKDIAQSFKDDKLSKSQLRAFFNETKAINNRLGEDREKFDSIYPLILLMKSKIEYRASKDKDKMKNLKDFILKAISQIQKKKNEGKGYESFKNFVIFFEAIVGYYYGI